MEIIMKVKNNDINKEKRRERRERQKDDLIMKKGI